MFARHRNATIFLFSVCLLGLPAQAADDRATGCRYCWYPTPPRKKAPPRLMLPPAVATTPYTARGWLTFWNTCCFWARKSILIPATIRIM